MAGRLAPLYRATGKLAALAVGGSVGRSRADAFSDLELDCYWSSPPSDDDRLAPIAGAGGRVTAWWEFDPDEEEWSEEYEVDRVPIGVSSFLVSSIERFLDDVVTRHDTALAKHIRLAALRDSIPLCGTDLLRHWRARARSYPPELTRRMILVSLAPDRLAGWRARQALVARGDLLALHDLMVRVERALLGALFALNGIYVADPLLKWQRAEVAALRLAPPDLEERLNGIWPALAGAAPAGPTAVINGSLAEAQRLLVETMELAESHAGADLGSFRAAVEDRRLPIDPPG